MQCRCEKKKKMEELCDKFPDIRKYLNLHETSGRLSLENSQPDLLWAIVDIAQYRCSADERRRTGSIHTVKTLELTEALHRSGLNIIAVESPKGTSFGRNDV